MADGMLRSPTFLVGAERQRRNLDEFKRREQQLAEAYHKNKPLCFNGCSYQKTHPVKAQKGHKDADACLTVPLVLGVADGVSQIEDFGIDASLLPNELLQVVEQLGMHQLIPGAKLTAADTYRGPVSMLRRAFEATESLGSLTVVLAVMDNSTRIHGKLHPMIAIITVGDCELIVLRRVKGPQGALELVCHTEMQRIDGHAQTPLQLARVDDRIDPNFNEELSIEVIERGSAVNCVSAYEGDIVLMGSDGVFDNLFLDEIVETANQMLPPKGSEGAYPEVALKSVAQRIVEQCHAKTRPLPNGMLAEAPIGRGGKKDDTSCVVAEVVEWTQDLQKIWTPPQQSSWWNPFEWTSLSSLMKLNAWCGTQDSDDEGEFKPRAEKLQAKRQSQNDWNDLANSGKQVNQANQVNPQQAYAKVNQAQEAQAYQAGNGYQGYQQYQAYNQSYQPNSQTFQGTQGSQGPYQSQTYDKANQGYQSYQGYNQMYPSQQANQGYQAYQGYAGNPGYQGYQTNQGYQANQYQGSQGYQTNGYQANGFQANSYQANGYQANGYQANGYQANGYQANGYQAYPQAQQGQYQMNQAQYPMNGAQPQQSFAASQIYGAQTRVSGGCGMDGPVAAYSGCAGRY